MLMEQHLQILTSVHRIRARTVEPVPTTPLSTPVTVLWTIQEKTVPIVSNVNALLFNVIRSEDEYSVKNTQISMFNIAEVDFPKTLRIYTFFMCLQRKYVIINTWTPWFPYSFSLPWTWINVDGTTFVDTDRCLPNPCQNGGTCSTEAYTYNCTCPAGYSGRNCLNRTYCFPLDLTLNALSGIHSL